jgi:tetratricopeptide (TPR) repeat protein
MNQPEIEKKYGEICQLVSGRKIKEAIRLLSDFLKYSTQSDYFYQLDSISDNYRNLLKYAYDGYQDEKRTEILNNISASLLSLADEVRQVVIEKGQYHRRFEKSQLATDIGVDPQTVTSRIEEFLFGQEVHEIVREAGAEISSEKFHDSLFKFIWLSGKVGDQHLRLVRRINTSKTIQWHEKCLVVSALTLSLLDYFDQEKFILLSEFIEAHEIQVYQRALIGLVIALIVYDQRLRFYPDLLAKLKDLSLDETVRKDVEAILLQILMARETEKITKEFEEEVLPEMKKVMPRLEDKLELGNLLENDDMDDKNPGWQDLIDEVPGLFERIEKFTRMQMEGGDVFMSTFSLLKHFDFFNRMSNWLVPFYPANPELNVLTVDDEQLSPRLLEGLEKAFYICNSDKYSFALNFQAVPKQQRSMIVTYFESELEQMKEMVAEEQMLDQSLSSNNIMTQYIQDLYRFFKLYPNKDEFTDFFRTEIRFSRLFFYQSFFERENFTERLAAFYFDKNHYPEAIQVYSFIVGKGSPKAEYFEKIGYSYQKMNRYREAIEQYKKADLFDADRLWVMRKIGYCFIKLKEFESALKYLSDAANIHPEDVNIRIQIAQCYLNLNNFDESLQQFSKARYFQPDNLKVLRPIAYCQFVLGRLDQALESYEEIMHRSDSPTPYDLMNHGHVLLCLGKRKEALEQYIKSQSGKFFSPGLFMTAFEEDIPHLLKNGIKEEEIPLLVDYLLFQGE